MTTKQDPEIALGPVRRALFKVCRKAHCLGEATETMESVYSKHKGKINSGYFYVPSTSHTGREVDEHAGEEKRLPHRERIPRAKAIEAVLSLRTAIDHAIQLVGDVSSWMDSPYESTDRRWTTRTVEELRELRGAILKGHTRDSFPSALPMIRAGVPDELRSASQAVAKRMEEIKSAILLGVQPQSPNSAMSPELLARFEAAAAKLAVVKDEAPKAMQIPGGVFLSETEIVKQEGISGATLRGRLPEWRRTHCNNDWHESVNRRPRDPQFLYRWASIKPLIDEIRRSSYKTASKKRPAK